MRLLGTPIFIKMGLLVKFVDLLPVMMVLPSFSMRMHASWAAILTPSFYDSTLFEELDISIAQDKCELIKIPLCKGIGYNYTMYDPYIGGLAVRQEEADSTLTMYRPMIDSGCSPYVKLFLCGLYAPVCIAGQKRPLFPCRPVCDHVRSSCEHILKRYSVPWPVEFQCANFLAKDTDGAHCTLPDDFGGPTIAPTTTAPNSLGVSKVQQCPDGLIPIIGSQTIACAPLCHQEWQYTEQEKYVVEITITVLATTGFFSTFLTILTFCIATKRFAYPERPVIWVAVCFLLSTVAYFIRIFGGSQFSCSKGGSEAQPHLTMGGEETETENGYCMTEFLFAYYFFQAGCLWWVNLTVSWFLSVSRKWSSEAISSRSPFFHVFAWVVPCLLASGVFICKKIDADELSGMCNVGNFDRDALLIFIIIPTLFYLICGGSLTIASIINAIKVRDHFRELGVKVADTNRMTVLLCKMGIFSVLFLVTLALLAACGLVEYLLWVQKDSPEGTDFPPAATPVFYLRALLPLVIAILSGGWICSEKTVNSWSSLFGQVGRKSRQKYVMPEREAYKRSPLMPLIPAKLALRSPVQSVVETAVTWARYPSRASSRKLYPSSASRNCESRRS